MRKNKSSRISFFGKEGFESFNFVVRLWQKRKFISFLVVIAVLFGLLFALFAEKKYIASAQILPQKEDAMNLELGTLAGLAGINTGSMFGDNLGVPVDLYPQIAGSYHFLDQLIKSEYYLNKEKITLRDYFDSDKGFGETILKYTVKLPWTLRAMLSSSSSQLNDSVLQNHEIVIQTKEDAVLFSKVKSIISVSSISEDGLITISVELNDPLLAAQITHKAIELLQQFIVDYKTGQIRAELEFIQQRYKEMYVEYEAARQNYLSYRDRHRYQVGERIDFEYKVLEDEYNRKETLFSELSRQIEQTQLMMRKETPEFVVFEPVKVPIEKSSPRTLVILFLSLFLSLFFAISLVAGYDLYLELREGLISRNEDAE